MISNWLENTFTILELPYNETISLWGWSIPTDSLNMLICVGIGATSIGLLLLKFWRKYFKSGK